MINNFCALTGPQDLPMGLLIFLKNNLFYGAEKKNFPAESQALAPRLAYFFFSAPKISFSLFQKNKRPIDRP